MAKNSGVTAKARPRGRPFKKGQRANPNGRPRKGNSLAEVLRLALEVKHDGKAAKVLLAEKLIEVGLTGNIAAIAYAFDRVLGRPQQSVELGGEVRTVPVNYYGFSDNGSD